MFKEKIAIVLVEPQSPGNIGMVCRAMKNMGLAQLRLVKGCRKDHPEAFKFAVSARDLLETAKEYISLEEALADCGISIATTRRHGQYRQEIFSPREIVHRLRQHLGVNRIALVFGREDNGLTTDELALCQWQATISTAEEYGSLNLAQAVLIFSYELFLGLRGENCYAQPRQLATNGEAEALYQHMERTLLNIGFLNSQNPVHLMRSLRRIFARAEMDSRETAILRGVMSQIDWVVARAERGESQ